MNVYLVVSYIGGGVWENISEPCNTSEKCRPKVMSNVSKLENETVMDLHNFPYFPALNNVCDFAFYPKHNYAKNLHNVGYLLYILFLLHLRCPLSLKLCKLSFHLHVSLTFQLFHYHFKYVCPFCFYFA